MLTMVVGTWLCRRLAVFAYRHSVPSRSARVGVHLAATSLLVALSVFWLGPFGLVLAVACWFTGFALAGGMEGVRAALVFVAPVAVITLFFVDIVLLIPLIVFYALAWWTPLFAAIAIAALPVDVVSPRSPSPSSHAPGP